MHMLPLLFCELLSLRTPPPRLPPMWSPLYLGGPLELVHGGVISRLAGSSLGSTNQIRKGLGHVFDGIDQHHLKESGEPR